MDELYTKLANLAARYGAQRLVLYGSRARGDFHARSDVDLAVYGMPEKQRGGFSLEAEDLPTLLKLISCISLRIWNPHSCKTSRRMV